MNRRTLLAGLAGSVARPALADDPATPFDAQRLRDMARELAAQPYKPVDQKPPEPYASLGYDAYRAIRFDPNQALWRGQDLLWQVQLFHRGWLYGPRVAIHEVVDGKARPIPYRPEMFTYPPGVPPATTDLGFSGFRLHAPINRPSVFDEVAVFQGASYFRAVGRNLLYGLSARGLSLGTADPGGEEFPAFRAFWIEKPPPGATSIVVNAIIDSPSAVCSMRTNIRPGDDTVMDVELVVFPRTDLDKAGIATGTSMFLFDLVNRAGQDDWRRAVHDSDGLQILTGRGEWLWRPLANPRALQVSVFGDTNPRGFGLMQRKRSFYDYEDLEARYEKRPSLWVEPIGDWGEGAIQLVEIPTKQEIHDNIVAFWRPRAPLRAKGEHGFTYRLHWCAEAPVRTDLAHFHLTGSGATPAGRVFVLEAAGPALKDVPPDAPVQARVDVSKGKIEGAYALQNPDEGGWRLSFELQPGDEKLIELRALLTLNDKPLTETWLYRWTP